ncbi:hypothetical protein ACFWBN_30070 [Streptomyces sp. NPDC059989]|uniref:hypothetical protein n=1 Tax=Streptomyces sp. NPDC059989 TaxID=3347026 RepID=UPI0036AE0048
MTCAALIAAPGPAHAQQFVPCSATALGNAITQANTTPGPAVLILSPRCTYTLTTPNPVDPDNGLPIVTSEINIIGNASTIRRVSTADFRILKLQGPGGRLTLSNLTIRDGRDASGGEGGGGISNENGQLTLNSVQVTRNWTTQSGAGGGIASSGTLTIRNSTLSFNISTANNGGGIFSFGTTTLSNTTVNGNTARDSGGGIDGRGTVTITSSTVADNAAGDDGGGLHLFRATSTVADTLIRGNTTDSQNNHGGGILNRDSTLTLDRVTIFANRHFGGGQGAGFANESTPGETVPTAATIRNSSITDNFARNAPGGLFNSGGTVNLVATPVENNIPTNCTPSAPPVTGCAN